MRRLPHATALLLAGWLLATPAPASAQSQPFRGGEAGQIQDRLRQLENGRGEAVPARDVRAEFRRVIERYPPALGKMLKLDPGLMSNQSYLAPYPAVWAYVQQHPEIPRDPGYFLDFVSTGNDNYNNPDWQAQQRWRDVRSYIAAFTVVGGIALTLAWIIRFSVDHRRWLRATKMHAELQHKLLERIGSNQELLAYVQSPAGQSLLQSLPVSIDALPSRGGLPFNRILWSVQLAFVLVAGGAGLLVARDALGEGFSGVARLMGTIGVSLGVGFALAAAASYMLSQKLGVFDANTDKMRPFGGA